MTDLAQNLSEVRTRIARAARLAGRDADSIELLPVTKFHPVETIAQLAELGIVDVAENREQEARDKAQALPQMRFHMIGQVQTKKANSVARWAHSVHSVDSIKLAEALNRGVMLAIERGERESDFRLDVFVQLSADGDDSRGGVASSNLKELALHIENLEHLRLAGVMVVPPLDWDPEPVFRAAARAVEDLSSQCGRRLRLSAGMSADLDEAIAAGSNIVRVGTAILGQRPVIST